MTRRILVATLAVGVALLVGVGSSLSPRPAHADPAAILLINPSICLAGAGSPPPIGCALSNGLEYSKVPGVGDINLRTLDQQLTKLTTGVPGAPPNDEPTAIEHPRPAPGDFAAIDLDKNQIHQMDGNDPSTLNEFAVMAFVNADAPVTFQTDVGTFTQSNNSTYTCDASLFIASTTNADPDCGAGALGFAGKNPQLMNEDGVVVAYLRCTAATCPLGTHMLNVVQQGIIFPVQFTVVGEPISVEFFSLEKAIQAGVPNIDGTSVADCPLQASVEGFQKALGEAEKTVLVARALDSNGDPVTGAWFKWSTSDDTMAVPAQPGTPTLDLGGFGLGAPNIICARQGAAAGQVTITARLVREFSGQHMDPQADPSTDPGNIAAPDLHSASITFELHAAPTKVSLSADPASLVCDGTTTTKVSALVTDDAGVPAVAGTQVTFDAQTLGTASPIFGQTDGTGVATSTIAPLATDLSGIPVNVTVVPTNTAASILIACQGAAPAGGAAGAGAGPAATGQIRPPSTGMGVMEGNAFPVWPAVAGLVGASFVLMVAAGALRRVRI